MQRFSPQLARPLIQFVVVIDAFVAGALVGKLAGASWGVALGVGQVVFAAVLVGVLMLGPRR